MLAGHTREKQWFVLKPVWSPELKLTVNPIFYIWSQDPPKLFEWQSFGASSGHLWHVGDIMITLGSVMHPQMGRAAHFTLQIHQSNNKSYVYLHGTNNLLSRILFIYKESFPIEILATHLISENIRYSMSAMFLVHISGVLLPHTEW